ncbi:MAG: chorismate mutase [Dehalococcoidia bacterium]
MRCRGIRGATTVETNSREAILAATSELLDRLVAANDIATDDIASAIFTTTADLNAEFPAVAARERGWEDVALMCGHEMNVPGSLRLCLRVLLHVNTERSAGELVHVYLNGARALRPDKQIPAEVPLSRSGEGPGERSEDRQEKQP